MAHPHLRVVLEATEQGVFVVELLEVGTAIFALACSLNLSAVGKANELSAIADAEDGQPADEVSEVAAEGFLVVNGVG